MIYKHGSLSSSSAQKESNVVLNEEATLPAVVGNRTFDISTLRWRHNARDSVSNHQPHHGLPNRLFGCRSKKTSKLRVTGLCVGNSPGTGEFPTQMASDAEIFPFDDVIMVKGILWSLGISRSKWSICCAVVVTVLCATFYYNWLPFTHWGLGNTADILKAFLNPFLKYQFWFDSELNEICFLVGVLFSVIRFDFVNENGSLTHISIGGLVLGMLQRINVFVSIWVTPISQSVYIRLFWNVFLRWCQFIWWCQFVRTCFCIYAYWINQWIPEWMWISWVLIK